MGAARGGHKSTVGSEESTRQRTKARQPGWLPVLAGTEGGPEAIVQLPHCTSVSLRSQGVCLALDPGTQLCPPQGRRLVRDHTKMQHAQADSSELPTKEHSARHWHDVRHLMRVSFPLFLQTPELHTMRHTRAWAWDKLWPTHPWLASRGECCTGDGLINL